MCALTTRKEIVENWLPRYTGLPLKKFGDYILLTNFQRYVDLFARAHKVPVHGRDKAMSTRHGRRDHDHQLRHGQRERRDGYGPPERGPAEGGPFSRQMRRHQAPRGRGRPHPAERCQPRRGHQQRLFPAGGAGAPRVRASQKAISTTIRDHALDYWTGTVYTTNRRVWEHDEDFKKYLRKIRVMAVDMETATIFMVGFANEIPTGCTLLGLPTSRWCPRGSRRPRATGRWTTPS